MVLRMQGLCSRCQLYCLLQKEKKKRKEQIIIFDGVSHSTRTVAKTCPFFLSVVPKANGRLTTNLCHKRRQVRANDDHTITFFCKRCSLFRYSLSLTSYPESNTAHYSEMVTLTYHNMIGRQSRHHIRARLRWDVERKFLVARSFVSLRVPFALGLFPEERVCCWYCKIDHDEVARISYFANYYLMSSSVLPAAIPLLRVACIHDKSCQGQARTGACEPSIVVCFLLPNELSVS